MPGIVFKFDMQSGAYFVILVETLKKRQSITFIMCTGNYKVTKILVIKIH